MIGDWIRAQNRGHRLVEVNQMGMDEWLMALEEGVKHARAAWGLAKAELSQARVDLEKERVNRAIAQKIAVTLAKAVEEAPWSEALDNETRMAARAALEGDSDWKQILERVEVWQRALMEIAEMNEGEAAGIAARALGTE